VTVLASLVDSLMDALASLINLMAVRLSLQPADDDHRFGHGKAEALAGLGRRPSSPVRRCSSSWRPSTG